MGYGIIEYAHYDDYKYAVDYLDGKQIKTEDGRKKILRFIKGDQLPAVEAHIAKNGMPKQEQEEQTNRANGDGMEVDSPRSPRHSPTRGGPWGPSSAYSPHRQPQQGPPA